MGAFQNFSLFLLVPLLLLGCANPSPMENPATTAEHVIPVVAAENFYGDIAQQLGADHVSVTSIVSNPNLDPHEYESSVQNAFAISEAQLVVENGAGYDSWMDKLLAASPDPNRIVIVADDIVQNKLSNNPHYWYAIDNIQEIAKTITSSLEKLDPPNTKEYEANLTNFLQSLLPIQQKMESIRDKYSGVPVGLTETIFLYQSNPMGLQVLTPYAFQKAISERNDPPASAVRSTIDQLTSHQIKVLIYNQQTITPITTNLENTAVRLNIPVVPVTETKPAGETYQDWMLYQLDLLQQALGG
jgi:zinc/manganese transport system substrate-binding protein